MYGEVGKKIYTEAGKEIISGYVERSKGRRG